MSEILKCCSGKKAKKIVPRWQLVVSHSLNKYWVEPVYDRDSVRCSGIKPDAPSAYGTSSLVGES